MITSYPLFDASRIDWTKGDGLIPAIVQDAKSLRVLMLGYVNQESLDITLSKGLVTFFSRTKQRLWQKGETSGHILKLCDIKLDCDGDTLLMYAEPEGPTCHLGTKTCFGEDTKPSLSTLADLISVIHMRHLLPNHESYTARLFEEGMTRIAQKVGEEGIEVALAAATKAPNLPSEAADLIYHLLVLLEACDTDFMSVLKILNERAHPKKK